ncbi:TPA: hypothetical protein RPO18_004478 [Escherichia coli]|nr:hypothetical protein [Escherichia coli]HDX6671866.1 hypothetical protein [Escherichia coli]
MFGTAKEIIEKLKNYPEDEPLLMVMWHKEDIAEVRTDLTDEQCVQVMQKSDNAITLMSALIGRLYQLRRMSCFRTGW